MTDVVRLGPGDLARYRAMNRLFAAAFEDEHAYACNLPSDDYALKLLTDRRFVALMAERDGKAVGALAAYELVKFEQERSELYIYDLAVAEAHRQQGVATAMIGWLQDHAARIGAWTIYVQADPPDAPAVALYDKLGTHEEVFHFDIPPWKGGTVQRPAE